MSFWRDSYITVLDVIRHDQAYFSISGQFLDFVAIESCTASFNPFNQNLQADDPREYLTAP